MAVGGENLLDCPVADEVPRRGPPVAGHDDAVDVPNSNHGGPVGDQRWVDAVGHVRGTYTEPTEQADEAGSRIVVGAEEGKRHGPEANPPTGLPYSPPFWM